VDGAGAGGTRSGGALAAADVNLLDGGGRTALHFAAGWGRVDVVAALLARGALLEPRDMWCKAPVDWALQAGQAAGGPRGARGPPPGPTRACNLNSHHP